MNEENQEPKQSNTNDQKPDDSSRSPGLDRGLSSSEDASKKNPEESSEDSEKK